MLISTSPECKNVNNIKNYSYRSLDQNFCGMVLYYNLDGSFHIGWKYKDGIVISKISSILCEKTLETWVLIEVCKNYELCTDWYVNGRYDGTTCNYWTECTFVDDGTIPPSSTTSSSGGNTYCTNCYDPYYDYSYPYELIGPLVKGDKYKTPNNYKGVNQGSENYCWFGVLASIFNTNLVDMIEQFEMEGFELTPQGANTVDIFSFMQKKGYKQEGIYSTNIPGTSIGLRTAGERLNRGDHLVLYLRYESGFHAVLVKTINIIEQNKISFSYMDPNGGITDYIKLDARTLINSLFVFTNKQP